MSGHTPGPWMNPESMHSTGVFQQDSDGRRGCKIADTQADGFGMALAERKANARLVAAAPDLLDVVEAGARYSNALKKLQDAGTGPGMVPGTDELDSLLEDWHNKAHAVLDKLKR